MSLNESIVEDAALIMPAATLTRPLPRGEGRRRGQLVSVTYKFDLKGGKTHEQK